MIKSRLGMIGRKLLLIVMLAATVLAVFLVIFETQTKEVSIREGVLDLSTWDAHEDGLVTLNGEWEFYWERFLNKQDFLNIQVSSPDKLATVPENWDHYHLN